MKRFFRIALTMLATAQLYPGSAAGAQLASGYSTRAYASRTELEAALTEAERLAATGSEDERRYHRAATALLRNRLREGDFQEGDRILLRLSGVAATNDTAVVRSGKVVHLPEMGEFSVAGLLRSELESKLTTHVAHYLRDPSLQALPLVRISVLGSVGRIGFYYSPADALLSDVLMLAGGPTAEADLKNVTVRRLGQVVWAPGDVRIALAEGLTIDGLHLRAGDEIEVGRKASFNWTTALQITSAVVGLVALALTMSNR